MISSSSIGSWGNREGIRNGCHSLVDLARTMDVLPLWVLPQNEKKPSSSILIYFPQNDSTTIVGLPQHLNMSF